MLGYIALDDVRVDLEAAAERGTCGYSHRPCFRKRLAAGLFLEAERVKGFLGGFEIAVRVGDREIDDAFPTTTRHGSAADVVHGEPAIAVLDGVNQKLGHLWRARIVIREDRGGGLIFADFEHLRFSATSVFELFLARYGGVCRRR